MWVRVMKAQKVTASEKILPNRLENPRAELEGFSWLKLSAWRSLCFGLAL